MGLGLRRKRLVRTDAAHDEGAVGRRAPGHKGRVRVRARATFRVGVRARARATARAGATVRARATVRAPATVRARAIRSGLGLRSGLRLRRTGSA